MGKSCRILYVAETCKGGVASWMTDVLKGLQEQGKEVHLSLLVPESEKAGFGFLPQNYIYTYRRTGRNVFSLVRFGMAVLQAQLRIQPDIVHLQSSFAGLVGRLALQPWRLCRRTKLVYTAHGWGFCMAVAPWKQNLYAKAERLLRPLCDAVTTISEDDHQQAIAWGLPQHGMVMIRNSCRPLLEKPDLQRKKKRRYAQWVFVGRFDHQKGLDILIQVMQELSREGKLEGHLKLVGEPVHGEPFQVPPELEGRVTLCGWMERGQLGKIIEESEVVIVPSRWEGFGLVALEAMSCGTAVLASRVGGLPEIVKEGESGKLVPVQDVQALKKVLKETTREEWWRMGEKGLTRYRKHFALDTMLKQLNTLYAGLVARRA